MARAIGYLTPQDRRAGRQAEIHAARDRKLLEEARSQRQLRLRGAHSPTAATTTLPVETEVGTAGGNHAQNGEDRFSISG
jgi:hypothetical protein